MLVSFSNLYFYKHLSIRYLWYIELIFPLEFPWHDKKKIYYHLEKFTIHRNFFPTTIRKAEDLFYIGKFQKLKKRF